jgi:hypothetical protein
LSFGEVVALAGDYFGTYDEMQDLTRTPTGRAMIAWVRWQALDLKRLKPKVPEPQVPDKVKDTVRERYYVLASRNLSHFSAGGSAWEAYVLWHSKAIADALQAGEQASQSAWRRALTKRLSAITSSQHVRCRPRTHSRVNSSGTSAYTPTRPIASFVTIAKFMYDRLDERQRLPPLAWWLSWLTKAKIKERFKLGEEAVGLSPWATS